MNKLIIVIALFVAVILVQVLMRKSDSKSHLVPVASLSVAVSAAAPPPPSDVTEISMLYSVAKKDWVEAAAASFQKEHPEIKLTITPSGSLPASDAILDGSEKPTIVSPADSLLMNLLISDWQSKHHTDLFARSGEDAPQPLVLTPLVFVAWEDRAEALLKASGGSITWKAIHKAVTAKEGWAAIKGKKEWGFVKLMHTDPTQSSAGLLALLSMTLEYYDKTTGLEVGDILEPKYQDFVRELEKAVPKFDTVTAHFMADMTRFGPSKYDIAVSYENIAISQIENAQGRWGTLKLYYPATTLWSDHPVAIVNADWVTEPQRKAARIWIDYLRSKPMQELALTFGFRPGNPAVPIKTADPKNPFTRLEPQGVKIDVNPMAPPPDGEVVRNLLLMWTRMMTK